MSFLYRSNVALRSAAARPSPRLFSTAVVYRKSATETVKDGLKAVDRTVADAAVKGIDAGGKSSQIEARATSHPHLHPFRASKTLDTFNHYPEHRTDSLLQLRRRTKPLKSPASTPRK
jgi:hypothetical protein